MDVTITATACAQGRTIQASILVVVIADSYTDIYRGDF